MVLQAYEMVSKARFWLATQSRLVRKLFSSAKALLAHASCCTLQASEQRFLRDFERKDSDRFRASRIQGDVLGDIERQPRFGPWRGCKVRPVLDNFDTA